MLCCVCAQERLNLPDDDVGRLLHSLSCAKYKILSKEPAGKNIAKADKFKFNNKFTDRMRRIKVRGRVGGWGGGACSHHCLGQGLGPAFFFIFISVM